MLSVSGTTLLTVDDSPLINEYARSILERLGAKRVFTAFSGDDACVLLRRNKDIELVITDIQMEHGNGLALLKSIRMGEDNIRRDIPVIVVTDFSYKSNVIKALQLNCNGFVSKPVNGEILARKISDALNTPFELKTVDEYARVDTSLTDAQSEAQDNENPHQKKTLIDRVKASGGVLSEMPPGWSPEYKSGVEERDKLLIKIFHLQELILKHVLHKKNASNQRHCDDLIYCTNEYVKQEIEDHQSRPYFDADLHQKEHDKIVKMTEVICKAIAVSHDTNKIVSYLKKLRETWHSHIIHWDKEFQSLVNHEEQL